MFIENKYTKIYKSLIESRIISPTVSSYYEKHHIIPKSMGGSNKKDNIVKLTAREHFIAHMLLVRITYGDDKTKMRYALMRLLKNPSNNLEKINSRYYEIARKENLKALKNKKVSNETRMKMSASQKGRYVSEETKKKISEAAKKRTGENNPFFGKNHSDETKSRISKSKLGRKQTTESNEKRSKSLSLDKNPFYGKKHSEETKRKMSEAAKERHKRNKKAKVVV